MFTLILTSAVGGYVVLRTLVWWFRMTNSDFGRKISKIPGPAVVPLVGNALQIGRNLNAILETMHSEWIRKYGRIYKIILGSYTKVVISSPEYIEKVLGSNTLIYKSEEYSLLDEWLGNGLITSKGAEWRHRRKLLTPTFHFRILEDFVHVFNEQTKVLVRHIEDGARDSKSEIDVVPYVTNCALDIICESAMGVSVHAQEGYSKYAEAVYGISEALILRVFRPWLANDLLFRLSPTGRKYRACLKTIRDFTSTVIKERKKAPREPDTQQNGDDELNLKPKRKMAFLDLLLKTAQDGGNLSDIDIQNEVDTFAFAGHDTNSLAMSWFLYLMAKNPDKQEKVYEELCEVFDSPVQPCTLREVPNLKYLECCIKETLRLYPSAISYERKCTEETTFGDFAVPVGATITISAYGVHRDSSIYPDPDKFLPERFFPENSAGRHPYAFIPFSAGPRNCIGQKFALIEQKVILSTLLRRFKFEVTPKTNPVPFPEMLLKPKGGVWLKVIPRF